MLNRFILNISKPHLRSFDTKRQGDCTRCFNENRKDTTGEKGHIQINDENIKKNPQPVYIKWVRRD